MSERWSNGRANLFCPASTAYSFKLTMSDGDSSSPPGAFPNPRLGPSVFRQSSQIRQSPYPSVSNPASSVQGNPHRPRIRNHPPSHSSTYTQINAILYSRFPGATPPDIALAASECIEFFESNNSLQHGSRPAQRLSASSNVRNVSDGFLQRKSQTYPLC